MRLDRHAIKHKKLDLDTLEARPSGPVYIIYKKPLLLDFLNAWLPESELSTLGVFALTGSQADIEREKTMEDGRWKIALTEAESREGRGRKLESSCGEHRWQCGRFRERHGMAP
jgi:hypothetical protein